MKINHNFGRCLIKKRFKKQKEESLSSITASTAIDFLIEGNELRSTRNKIQKLGIDEKDEEKEKFFNSKINLYNTDKRMPPRVSHKGLSKEDFKNIERRVFNLWKLKNDTKIFERNLEIWRQYWIAIERSNLIIQVIDCRCIDLFLVEDIFEEYKNKKHILLLNKCDLIGVEPEEIIMTDEFKNKNCMNKDKIYILEKLKKYKLQNIRAFFINNQQSVENIIKEYKNTIFVFTGFPNVGKSSTINNLFKTNKVTVSKTPGKTKHLQSLFIGNNQVIDTPGIVFPTENRTVLLLYGIISIDTTDFRNIIEFIIESIGLNSLINHYKLKKFINDSRNTKEINLLNSFCLELSYDIGKAVKVIIKDFMEGKIEKLQEIEYKANYDWYDNTKVNLNVKKVGNTFFVGK